LTPESQRYYLADPSNAGIDIIDAEDHAFLRRIGGFAGQAFNANGTPDNDHSGPDGVLVIPEQHQLWAGDGDSTVKVIDLDTNQIIDVIHTNGTARADEMAFDPRHHILAVVNNADDPPFVTLISSVGEAHMSPGSGSWNKVPIALVDHADGRAVSSRPVRGATT
jgi:DNA-binding beta-propeller fold protein YncE